MNVYTLNPLFSTAKDKYVHPSMAYERDENGSFLKWGAQLFRAQTKEEKLSIAMGFQASW